MQCKVTFYALSDANRMLEQTSEEQKGQQVLMPSELVMAADLSVTSVKAKQKITVLCKTQTQAEAFDEFIWQYPPQDFVPHNLYGEGPDMGTPMEIIWDDAFKTMTKLRNRAVVINLSEQFIHDHASIGQIVDFVPIDEQAKVLARERYKQYKQAGCQLEYKTS